VYLGFAYGIDYLAEALTEVFAGSSKVFIKSGTAVVLISGEHTSCHVTLTGYRFSINANAECRNRFARFWQVHADLNQNWAWEQAVIL
jgi:hypothetical protein